MMTSEHGAFAPNSEVDEIRWLPYRQALDLLSYEQDRALLRTTPAAS